MIRLINRIKKIPAFFIDIWDEIVLCIKDLKISVYRVNGKSKHGDELIIYHLGRTNPPNHFLKKFYLEKPIIEIEKYIYFWQIKGKLESIEKQGNLAFLRLHKWLAVYIGRDLINIPEMVRLGLDLNKDDAEFEKIFNYRSIKDDLRKIEKYNYTYEISRDPDNVEFFYNNMNVPFIKMRHRHYARLFPMNTVHKFCTEGILFIKKDGKYVAGTTLQKMGTTMVTRMVGVLNGDEALLKQSVIAAVYYFLIKFSKENGYKKLDFGGTAPILNDGILWYKSKWGMTIMRDRWDSMRFMLQVRSLNDASKKVLFDNPMIAVMNGKMGMCIFSDSTIPNDKIAGTQIPARPDYFNGIEFTKIVTLN